MKGDAVLNIFISLSSFLLCSLFFLFSAIPLSLVFFQSVVTVSFVWMVYLSCLLRDITLIHLIFYILPARGREREKTWIRSVTFDLLSVGSPMTLRHGMGNRSGGVNSTETKRKTNDHQQTNKTNENSTRNQNISSTSINQTKSTQTKMQSLLPLLQKQHLDDFHKQINHVQNQTHTLANRIPFQ